MKNIALTPKSKALKKILEDGGRKGAKNDFNRLLKQASQPLNLNLPKIGYDNLYLFLIYILTSPNT